ncbi:MAG: hypothetical protein JJU40_08095 [Rhodobacteraceae bacterium]|nr:hypothetical protein [Paracoccaceae bacterium]
MIEVLAEARGWIAALACAGALGGVALAALLPRFNIGLAGDLAAGAGAGAALGVLVSLGPAWLGPLLGPLGLAAAGGGGAAVVLAWGAALDRRAR